MVIKMPKNNPKLAELASVLLILVAFLFALFAMVFVLTNKDEIVVEPLSVTQQQAIIMQVGLNGFKNLIKVKCYDSIVVRTRTEKWNDQYCARSYNHLDFAKIVNG